MATFLILLLIVAVLALVAAAGVEWGVDSREGAGDDHQRRIPGGVR